MTRLHDDRTVCIGSACYRGDCGNYIKCDRCGLVSVFDRRVHEIEDVWHFEIFYKCKKPGLPDFCYECAKSVTPLVYALRDVYELQTFVNKLERNIRERQRIENDRATARDAG